VNIRSETEADHPAIRKVNEEAFRDKITAGLVETIRGTDRFVPELSLVAEVEDEVVGHVMLSFVDIEPGPRRVLQVGPLAVLPPHQRRGLGSEPLILIEGNPRYYERFGFTRADESGIETPKGAHGPQYFMVRPLSAYDPALRGQAVYPPETFGTVI
jgi:putative acetyltransferase